MEESSGKGNIRREKKRSGIAALRWLILAAILGVALWWGIQAMRSAPVAGAGQGAAPAGGPHPATVITVGVTADTVQKRHRVTGSLRAVERAEVAAREAGAVVKVHVDEGAVVKEGDLLVSLDARRMNAELAESKARLTASKAMVTQMKAEAKRATSDLKMKNQLFEQRAVSEREFLDSQRASSVANAKKDAADDEFEAMENAVTLMEVRLEDLQIKAPFDGKVVARHVNPGEWLSPGGSVVTLVSTGTIEAWMNVPERFIGAVQSTKEKWSVTADGSGVSSEVKGIRAIADIDPRTRLFPVIIELDDQNGAMVPGQSVHAELPVSAPDSLLVVPVDAVVESFSGAHVYKAAPQKEGEMPISEKVPVEVKFRKNAMVFLSAETLKVGDRVVVEGNERLFPGTPLMVSRKEDMEGEGTNAELPPKP